MHVSIYVIRRTTRHYPLWDIGNIEKTGLVQTPDFCCGNMADQWGESVYLPERGIDLAIISNPRHWPEGCHNDWESIAFCPFCGEAITIESGEPDEPSNQLR